jgi:hypothetical protein
MFLNALKRCHTDPSTIAGSFKIYKTTTSDNQVIRIRFSKALAAGMLLRAPWKGSRVFRKSDLIRA